MANGFFLPLAILLLENRRAPLRSDIAIRRSHSERQQEAEIALAQTDARNYTLHPWRFIAWCVNNLRRYPGDVNILSFCCEYARKTLFFDAELCIIRLEVTHA